MGYKHLIFLQGIIQGNAFVHTNVIRKIQDGTNQYPYANLTNNFKSTLESFLILFEHFNVVIEEAN